ncbi:hypothetical protein B0H12DRAFT_1122050, partial [Mycena haematopus]
VTLSHLFSVLVLAALLHCSPSVAARLELDIYLFPCLSPGAPTLLPHIHAPSASNISGNMPPCTQRAPVGSYERDISDGYTSSGGNQYAGGEGSGKQAQPDARAPRPDNNGARPSISGLTRRRNRCV